MSFAKGRLELIVEIRAIANFGVGKLFLRHTLLDYVGNNRVHLAQHLIRCVAWFVSAASCHDHGPVVVKFVAQVVQPASQIQTQLPLFHKPLIQTRAVVPFKNQCQQGSSGEIGSVLCRNMIAGGERWKVCELVWLRKALLLCLWWLRKVWSRW